MAHAFFKALLFLGAGSVIHACDGEQDMRKMGGLRSALPITHATMLIGSLALMGIPIFSGFFSKDEILFMAEAMPRGSMGLYAVGALAAFLTAIYTIRMLSMTFWGKARAGIHGHESPWVMTVPLLVLAVLATFGGFLGVPHELAHAVGLPSHLIAGWLDPVVPAIAFDPHQAPLSEGLVSVMAIALAVIGAFTGTLLFKKSFALPLPSLGRLLEGKYFIDELYMTLFVRPLYAIGDLIARTLEGRFLQNLGTWMGVGSSWSGDRLRTLQSGDLQVFALVLLAGLSLIVAISLFWIHL